MFTLRAALAGNYLSYPAFRRVIRLGRGGQNYRTHSSPSVRRWTRKKYAREQAIQPLESVSSSIIIKISPLI